MMNDLRVSFPRPCGERWEDMHATGCNRFCAVCSETIHDLRGLTFDEAEVLLQDPRSHCVRAQVRRDGSLCLKPDPKRGAKKIVIAAGASITFLASACETVPQVARGTISGKAGDFDRAKSVTATSEDGKKHRTTVNPDGSYRFKSLPIGRYVLRFYGDCGKWDGKTIVVEAGQNSIANSAEGHECIIVGLAKIENDQG